MSLSHFLQVELEEVCDCCTGTARQMLTIMRADELLFTKVVCLAYHSTQVPHYSASHRNIAHKL